VAASVADAMAGTIASLAVVSGRFPDVTRTLEKPYESVLPVSADWRISVRVLLRGLIQEAEPDGQDRGLGAIDGV
jgi:hypothetical protein